MYERDDVVDWELRGHHLAQNGTKVVVNLEANSRAVVVEYVRYCCQGSTWSVVVTQSYSEEKIRGASEVRSDVAKIGGCRAESVGAAPHLQ